MTKLKTAVSAALAVALALGVAACDLFPSKEKAEPAGNEQSSAGSQVDPAQPEAPQPSADPSATPPAGGEPAPTTPPSE
jgi:hypothetical protein